MIDDVFFVGNWNRTFIAICDWWLGFKGPQHVYAYICYKYVNIQIVHTPPPFFLLPLGTIRQDFSTDLRVHLAPFREKKLIRTSMKPTSTWMILGISSQKSRFPNSHFAMLFLDSTSGLSLRLKEHAATCVQVGWQIEIKAKLLRRLKSI